MAEFAIFDNLIEKAIGGVANMALGAAKGLTREFMKDTPSIIATDPTNLAVTDIPRSVVSLSVRKDDFIPPVNEVVSIDLENVHKMTSIVERCKIPSRLTIVNWSATHASGTRLYNTSINPSMSDAVTVGPQIRMDGTALSYFAQFFEYWRGGIRITVECLPSKFHQGQLYLAFNPNMAATSLFGARNCTSATIDLGVNNRTSLDIPFVSSCDYLQCPIFNYAVTTATLKNSLGLFSIFVQNELDSSGTVANNIDMNVYVEALDDFEFKVPRSLPAGVEVYYDGQWQMDAEVVRNEKSDVPNLELPNVVVPTNVSNASRVANVKTADTENIMSREYLLSPGQTVSMSAVASDTVYNQLFPSGFFLSDLASTGLFNYHELYRMDFKFTIRINPTPFNQGALMLVWLPGNQSPNNVMFGTMTQYPHALLNVGSETSASITVPFSSMVRMLRGTFPDMGALKVVVWNQIRAPTAAPQTLKFSIWAQALNVHMAVKRQVGTGMFQSLELSDTATQQTTQQVAFEEQTAPKAGFMRGEHDNVLTLLRRFIFCGHNRITNVDNDDILPATWYTPVFCGREHTFLKETYAFSSGSQRLMIGHNVARQQPITGFVFPIWRYQTTSSIKAVPYTVGYPYTDSLGGASQFYPGDTQERIFEFPYYSQVPLVANTDAQIDFGNAWPNVRISYKNQNANSVLQSFIWHAVGDDYMVYYPIAFKSMRWNPPAGPLAREDPEFDHLAQSGDVESNPGPDDPDVDTLDRCGDVEKNPGPAFPDISGAASAMTCVANEMREAIPEMKSTCASVKIAADEGTRVASVIRDFVTSMKEKPMACAKPLTDTLVQLAHRAISYILDIFTHVYNLYNGGKARALSAMALIAKLSQHMGSQLLNKLQSVAESMGVWQGTNDFSLVVSMAPAIVGSLMSIFNSEFGHDDQRSFRYRLNEKLDCSTSSTETIAAIFNTIVEYVFEGTGWGIHWYKHSQAELIQFVRDVDTADSSKTFTTITMQNESVRKDLRVLYKFAQKIKAYGPLLPRFSSEYMKAAGKVVEWSKLVTKVTQSARVPTIGIAFEGSSGVGKSFLASNVMPAILMLKLGKASTAEEGKSMVWNKPTGAENHFFDGYRQQPIAYIDDFLKTVEAKDAQDVINMISCSQFPVDMAHLDDKGMLFKSDFLFVTTNTRNFAAVHGLSHPEALCTRFGHAVSVSLSDTKMTGSEAVNLFTEGLSKVTTSQEMIDLASKFWVLKRLNVNGGKIGEAVSLQWFIDDIVKTYTRFHDAHARVEAAFKGITQGSTYHDCPETMPGAGSLEAAMFEYKDTLFLDDFFDLEDDYKDIFLELAAAKGISKGKVVDVKNPLVWETITPEDLYATLAPPSKWKGILKMLAIAGVAVAAVTALYLLAKQSIGLAMGVFQGKAYDSVRPKPKPRPSGMLQGIEDKMERVRKNIRYVEIYDIENDERLSKMYGLMLGGKRILLPRHFVKSLAGKRKAGINCYMRIEKLDPRGNSVGYIRVGYEAMLAQDVVTDDGRLLDLSVVHMHNVNVNGARHVSQLIPDIKEHRKILSDRLLAGKVLFREEIEDISVQLGRRGTIPFRSEEEEVFFMMVAELPTNVKTRMGDCGLPYVVLDNSVQSPLVGLHSALITSLDRSPAGCTPLVREWIQKAMDKLDVFAVSVPIEQTGLVQGDEAKSGYWQSAVHCEGHVQWNNIPLSVYPLQKTEFTPWLEHQDWPVKYGPSAKGVGNGRHALYSNAQKHDENITGIVPFRAHNMCVERYASKFEKDRDTSVFTEREMINGRGAMTSLVMGTSCGFISKWFKDGKHELFDGVVDGLNSQVWSFSEVARTRVIPIYSSSFTQRLAFVEEEMREGKVPFMVWVATLKDELRPLAKVEAVKTRVFEQPPLELTLLIRKYFGSFLNWVKTHHGPLSHSAIGIDKEAVWRDYWLSLKSKGSKGFDVDYTNYDGSVSSQAFDFFRDVTDRYYRDHNPVRHALLFALQNAWMVVGEYVVFTEQGNKSGNPMTDVFNSITNVYVIYLSYLQGRIEKGLSFDFNDFDRDVVCLTYGDDVICSVDDATGDYFNRCTVARTAGVLGMVVTAADKGNTLIPLQPLEELTFLKSKFVEVGPLVLSPLPHEVALRELQFIKKRNKGDHRIRQDMIRNSLRFVAHQGEEAVRKLQSQLEQLGCPTEFSYNDFFLDVAEKQGI